MSDEQAFQRLVEASDRQADTLAGFRDEFREISHEMIVRIERNTQVMVEGFERLGRGQQAMIAELRDLGAESRAQRRALLSILDRLGPGPGAASG